MKVIDSISDFERQSHAVVTIGTFDGVHIGHQAILKQLISRAKKQQGTSILITFWPHPRFVLKHGKTDLQLLSTFEEKVALLMELGLDYLVKIPFTPEFSNLSAEEFIQKILVQGIGTKELYIGYDHRFGNNREGNLTLLEARSKAFGYEVNEIPRQDIDTIGVSSTKIREALHSGEIDLAKSLLGRNYTVTGQVIEGQRIGRTIGFPTANLKVTEDYKLLPSDGSYAVEVEVKGRRHKGMMNIGFKPTVDGSTRSIEVHIFEFDDDIYSDNITVEFIKALRKEMKFKSLEELKKQLALDKVNALNILL